MSLPFRESQQGQPSLTFALGHFPRYALSEPLDREEGKMGLYADSAVSIGVC
jgi:hypothetical protein